MEYTKGEWKQHEHLDTGEMFITSNAKNIAFTSRPRTKEDKLEVGANAQLIAAAPDMYEALISASGSLKLYDPGSPAIDEIAKALAKAEGK